jgi:6-phosphogluconolactonase
MTQASAAARLLHIGCYTAGAGGAAAGLDVLVHNPQIGAWTTPPGRPAATASAATASAATDGATGGGGTDIPESPSFLAWHPDGRHLYAVGEVQDGRVWAFEVDEAGGAPRVLGSADTGGAFPCHLSVDPSGRWLVSANYGSGSLAVHELLPNGAVGRRTDLVQHEGSGPDDDRQAGPHAHMAVFVTDTLVLAIDLGVDGVAAYRLDPQTGRLEPATDAWSSLPAGFGPRHLVMLPGDLVALAGELTGEIALLRLDPVTGGLTLLDLRPASATGRACAPSGIDRSADGGFVLIANRGPDTVASFAVDPAPGELRLVSEMACGGAHPRAITVIGELVYVANQHGGNITVLRWDPLTGELADTGSRVSLPTPTHVLGPPPHPPRALKVEAGA